MSQLGFIDKYLDNANKFYRLAMNQFDFYLKIMGTDVVIIRVKDDSAHKNVFGTVYSSNLNNDEDLIKLKYRILINMNDMRRIFSQSADNFEVYDNRDVMKMGDIIEFSRRDKTYQFKITEVQAFSEASDVLWRYTLVGQQEVKQF